MAKLLTIQKPHSAKSLLLQRLIKLDKKRAEKAISNYKAKTKNHAHNPSNHPAFCATTARCSTQVAFCNSGR